MIDAMKVTRSIYFATLQGYVIFETKLYSRKVTEIGGDIPMEMFISQQPKAIESRNWCQMIALTISYNLVIRYILRGTRNLSFLIIIL